MPTLTIGALKDNSLNENTPTSNYGTATYMNLWHWSGGDSRPILSFDISSIPSGAIIISATLSLYYYLMQSANPSGETVYAYKCTRNDWSETESTWNRFKTDNNWTTAGGDYVTSNPAGGSTTFPSSPGAWLNWDIKDIVEDAITNSVNVNVIIRFQNEGGTDSSNRFYSREYTGDTSLRPKLVIEYIHQTISVSENIGTITETFKGNLDSIKTENIEFTESISVLKAILLSVSESFTFIETFLGDLTSKVSESISSWAENIIVRLRWRMKDKPTTTWKIKNKP